MKTGLAIAAWVVMAVPAAAATPATPAAPAAKVERYEQLALAQAIDEKCGFLPFLEHKALDNIAWDAMAASTFKAMSDKMNKPEILTKFYDQQDAKAAAMPCTPQTAQTHIVPVRSDVVNELAIAVAMVEVKKKLSEPATNGWNAPTVSAPTADDIKAAQQLQGYVQHLWGANAPANWQWALRAAQTRLNTRPNDSASSQILYMVDYQARAERDKLALVAAPGSWQRVNGAEGKTALTQRRGMFGGFGSGFVYLTVRDGQILASGHKSGVDDLTGLTGFRVFIRKPETPTLNKEKLPITWDAAWRSQAQSFDMTATPEKLYGGTVYKAAPAAMAALKALNEDDEIEVAPIIGGNDQAAGGGTMRPTFKVRGLKAALTP